MRAAVFGPRPGRRRNCVTSSGTSARRFSSADISPVSVSSTIFASIVAPIPEQLLRLAGERELGDRRARLPDPRRRASVREHAKPLLAEDLRDVGERVEGVGDVRVPGQRGHRADHRDGLPAGGAGRLRVMPTRAVVCVPTYDERENLEPMVRALGEVLDTTRDRVLVIDDGSPDGTGEIADRLAAELAWLDVLHRTTKEGIGRAYLAGFARALESGRGARARDGLRLLARPARRAAPDRRVRGRRRPRARLALGRRAAAP